MDAKMFLTFLVAAVMLADFKVDCFPQPPGRPKPPYGGGPRPPMGGGSKPSPPPGGMPPGGPLVPGMGNSNNSNNRLDSEENESAEPIVGMHALEEKLALRGHFGWIWPDAGERPCSECMPWDSKEPQETVALRG